MPLIPWEYLKKHLFLPTITPTELAEKLSYYGLETKIIKKQDNLYYEFDTLPNRTDLLSWQGIVQEISLLLNCQIEPFNPPVINEGKEKLVEVTISTNDCWEFHFGLIKNIEVKESPQWVKKWLEANNIRSINNLVDIANLVMLETGQPFHIFDYDSVPKEKKIVIHEAREGETMTALHGQKLTLNSRDIIISSGGKIIDLAGIIGTQDTALTLQTKNVLIECASFNPASIKKTAKSLNISTLASQFFSREANLILTPHSALSRVIALIIESYGGDLNFGTIFTYKKTIEKEKPTPIAISLEFIAKKIGQDLSEQVINSIWQRLNFLYHKEGNIYYVIVPSYRLDLTSPEDLLEEILRVYDYNKINSSLPTEFRANILADNKIEIEKKKLLRSYLANCGWQEIITYSLISHAMKEEFQEKEKDSFYQLLMPKNDYHKYYRQNLLASHLKVLKYNFSRGNKNLFFFEISSVYGPSQQPEELLILSGLGKIFNQPLQQLVQELDFYWLKGVLTNIFELWQINSHVFFATTTLNFLYSPQSVEIFLGQEKIGFLGRVQTPLTQKYQLNDPVFVAQISLTKIFSYLGKSRPKLTYRPVSNFPTSEKDLSFIFPEEINYNELVKEIKNTGGDNLQEVSIFDVYQSAELAKEKKKSVSFHLLFQSSSKTLENKEIEKILGEVVTKVEKLFAGKLRE